MKNLICGVLVMLAICGCVYGAFYLTNQYKKEATVVKADRGSILFEDVNGELWAIDYEKGYKVGDKVLITFDSQGTWDTVEDDEILNVDRVR